jgi:hypothetical protein
MEADSCTATADVRHAWRIRLASGAHSDDEKQLVVGAPILSVSLGATRKFRVRDRGPGKAVRHNIDLKHGEGGGVLRVGNTGGGVVGFGADNAAGYGIFKGRVRSMGAGRRAAGVPAASPQQRPLKPALHTHSRAPTVYARNHSVVCLLHVCRPQARAL